MSTPPIAPVAPEVTARLAALAATWESRARELWHQIQVQNLTGARSGCLACTASAHETAARELRALSAELAGPLEGGVL